MSSTQKQNIAGVDVYVTAPNSPTGVVILLTGFTVSVSEYNSYRDALVAKGYVVIAYAVGFGPSHDEVAASMVKVFNAYRQTNTALPNDFGVLGHSAGGKVSLLIAANTANPVKTVLALDPVDDKPPEFTNEGGTNLTLRNTSASSITIVHAAATPTGPFGINPKRNAASIYNANQFPPKVRPLITDQNAGHFAYTDNGGYPASLLMFGGGGTRKGNEAAHAHALQLTNELF